MQTNVNQKNVSVVMPLAREYTANPTQPAIQPNVVIPVANVQKVPKTSVSKLSVQALLVLIVILLLALIILSALLINYYTNGPIPVQFVTADRATSSVSSSSLETTSESAKRVVYLVAPKDINGRQTTIQDLPEGSVEVDSSLYLYPVEILDEAGELENTLNMLFERGTGGVDEFIIGDLVFTNEIYKNGIQLTPELSILEDGIYRIDLVGNVDNVSPEILEVVKYQVSATARFYVGDNIVVVNGE